MKKDNLLLATDTGQLDQNELFKSSSAVLQSLSKITGNESVRETMPNIDRIVFTKNNKEKASITNAEFKRFNDYICTMCRTNLSAKYVLYDDTDAPLEFKNRMMSIMGAAARAKSIERLCDMYIEYNVALMDRKCVGDVRDVSDFNIIDATSIVTEHDESLEDVYRGKTDMEEFDSKYTILNEYARKSGFYSVIPCYTTGILYLKNILHVKWNILDINLDNESMLIEFEAYIPAGVFSLNINLPYALFTVNVKYDTNGDPNEIPFMITEGSCYQSLSNLFKEISPKKFKWTKDERILWLNTFVKFAKAIDSLEANGEASAMFQTMMTLSNAIFTSFCEINRILHELKLRNKAKARNSKKISDSPEAIHAFDKEKQDKRKFLVIEGIKFYADSLPQEMSKKSVMKYQVASWTVRGHVRRYKSGKEVYIEPHVSHRKNMNQVSDNIKPAPRTIDLSNTSKKLK